MDREAFDFTNLKIDGSVGGALGNLGARSPGDRGIDEAELDELACGTLIRGVYN
jgi:tRNA 2-thiocytidine biosynthesis protein TtcA